MNITLDTLWHRIGDDGLPPLAKSILVDGVEVAQIIDDTDYLDLNPDDPRQPKRRFKLEWLTGTEWVEDDAVAGGFRFASEAEALAHFKRRQPLFEAYKRHTRYK